MENTERTVATVLSSAAANGTTPPTDAVALAEQWLDTRELTHTG